MLFQYSHIEEPFRSGEKGGTRSCDSLAQTTCVVCSSRRQNSSILEVQPPVEKRNRKQRGVSSNYYRILSGSPWKKSSGSDWCWRLEGQSTNCIWKNLHTEDLRYFVRTARKKSVNRSLISFYLVAEKNYNYWSSTTHPPPPWRATLKWTILRCTGLPEKGYIASRASLMVTLNC